MGRKSPWTVTVSPNERDSVKAATVIDIGRVVNFAGAQVSTLGAAGYGIAMQNGAIGEMVPIVTGSQAVGQVGAAVTLGAELTSSAAGKLVPAATGNFVIARALEAAANADEYIRVDVSREGNKA